MPWKCNNCETVNSDYVDVCEVCDSIPPVIIDLSCNCCDINKPSICSFHAQYADSIFLQVDKNKPEKVLSNEIPLNINKSTSLTLIAVNKIAERKKTIHVLVEPPIIEKFEAESVNVLERESVTIRWSVISANYCYINGIRKKSNGEETISAIEDITLTAKNSEGITSKSLKLTVHPRPIISFKASKEKLYIGDDNEVELSWNVKNAASTCLINPNGDKIECKQIGKFTISPTETITYSLRVIALDKKTIRTKSVTVNVYPKPTAHFTIDKDYISQDEPFTLSWNIENANYARFGLRYIDMTGSMALTKFDFDKDNIIYVTDLAGETIEYHPFPYIKIDVPQIVSTNELFSMRCQCQFAERVIVNGNDIKLNDGVFEKQFKQTKDNTIIDVECYGASGICVKKHIVVRLPFKPKVKSCKYLEEAYLETDNSAILAWEGENIKEISYTGKDTSGNEYTHKHLIPLLSPNRLSIPIDLAIRPMTVTFWGEKNLNISLSIAPVNILHNAIINECSALSKVIYDGDACQLQWKTQYVKDVIWGGDHYPANGTFTWNPWSNNSTPKIGAGGSKTFETQIKFVGESGKVNTRKIQVFVYPKPKIIKCKANKKILYSEDSLTFTWDTVGIKSATLNWKKIKVSDSFIVNANRCGLHTYRFDFVDYKEQHHIREIDINVYPRPTYSVNFEKEEIKKGLSTTISWNTTNCSKVLFNGHREELNGTITLSPTSNKSYNIEFYDINENLYETITKKIIVRPPQIFKAFWANFLNSSLIPIEYFIDNDRYYPCETRGEILASKVGRGIGFVIRIILSLLLTALLLIAGCIVLAIICYILEYLGK